MIRKNQLVTVKECIAYVEGLGYTLTARRRGYYHFEVVDKSTRPIHNWEMNWTLGEMRHAVVFGC